MSSGFTEMVGFASTADFALKVYPGQVLKIKNHENPNIKVTGFLVYQYDKDGNYISPYDILYSKSFTILENAEYARISFISAYLNLELNTEIPNSYIPYFNECFEVSYNESSDTDSEEEAFTEGLEIVSNGTYCTVAGIGTATDTEIVIPNTYNSLPVQEISMNAFRDNETITSVTLPENLTKIGPYSFYRCTNLKTLICKSANAPEFVYDSNYQSWTFEYCPITRVVIPKGSMNSYSVVPQYFSNWVYKGNIVVEA